MNSVLKSRASPQAVASRMLSLRTARGLSQAALAKLANVSQQCVAAIETCRIATPRHLEILSEVLGVHPEYIRSGRLPGVPLYIVNDLRERSSYPHDDSELPLAQAMLVPHLNSYSAATFALYVDNNACAASGVTYGSLVVVDPEVAPVAGDHIVVHYKTGPTVRRYKDTGADPEYIADDVHFASFNVRQTPFVGTVVEVRRLRTIGSN